MSTSSGNFNSGENAPAQCTATSKRSGVRCKGPAIAGSPGQKCRMHGGVSGTIGTANPGFKTGRHSKYLPSQLDALYREALSNPELVEMSDHIALLEARIQEVLGLASDGDPVPQWADLLEVFGELTTTILGGKQDEVIGSLERMQRLLDAGAKWDTTWGQITHLMESLRKLTDTEIKRKKELNQMVPVERVVILMAAMGTAVKRNVKDPEQVAAVYRELALLHGTDVVPGSGMKRVGPEVVDLPLTRKQREAEYGRTDA